MILNHLIIIILVTFFVYSSCLKTTHCRCFLVWGFLCDQYYLSSVAIEAMSASIIYNTTVSRNMSQWETLKKINCRETYFWLNSNKTNFENKESLNFVRNYANIWRRKNVIFATGPYNYGSFALWKLYHAERYMLICGFYLTELIVLNNNFKRNRRN